MMFGDLPAATIGGGLTRWEQVCRDGRRGPTPMAGGGMPRCEQVACPHGWRRHPPMGAGDLPRLVEAACPNGWRPAAMHGGLSGSLPRWVEATRRND